MKKIRRSARIADMAQYLATRPHLLIPLTFFKERYGAAKSSISEDLQMIDEILVAEGTGGLQTVSGAAGGVKYVPKVNKEKATEWIQEVMQGLKDPARLLPGGYLYLTDYLHQPQVVNRMGQIFSSIYTHTDIDYVMTVETKGIPLAYATAQYLNKPFVIARRDHRVTEGSVVSINYISGSSKRIQTMSLSRRGLKEHSKVLIVDDFMKAGGTIRGMIDLLKEFKADVVGVCVLVESTDTPERLVDDVLSLIRLHQVDMKDQSIKVKTGSLFQQLQD